MKLSTFLVSTVLAMVCLNASSAMADPADEATLFTLEQKWIDMAQARDVAGLNAFIDDSYRANTPNGIQTKADMLVPSPTGTTQKLQGLTAKVDGDKAIVFGENIISSPTGSPTKIRFVDLFERTKGNWRVVESYVTR
jgi:ketosteroid isomerase-like protein